VGLHNAQLSVPGAAIADSNSVEIMRAWIASNGLHCSIKVGIWENKPDVNERHAWGIVLADLARHVADAFSLSGMDKGQTLSMIRQAFLVELKDPTSGTSGEFADGPSRN